MRIYQVIWLCCTVILFAGCSPSTITHTPSPNATLSIVTPSEPSGTVMEKTDSKVVLSHPNFNWEMELPADWTITFDSGFQVQATSANQQVSLRLQAQRWKQATDRLPDARSYVDHWKNFVYGNVFPLYANGTQVAETEIGQDKFGGPYLHYEFDDSKKEVRYLQVYASAGGPSSAMLSIWTSYDEYEDARVTIQSIIDSFALTETSQ